MPTKHEGIEYGNIKSFRPTKELEAAIRQQMDREKRALSDMLRILILRGLVASKGVTWEGRKDDVN